MTLQIQFALRGDNMWVAYNFSYSAPIVEDYFRTRLSRLMYWSKELRMPYYDSKDWAKQLEVRIQSNSGFTEPFAEKIAGMFAEINNCADLNKPSGVSYEDALKLMEEMT